MFVFLQKYPNALIIEALIKTDLLSWNMFSKKQKDFRSFSYDMVI